MESHHDRAELFDLYKVSVDEYRFQVTLNWQRTQYYLALNAGFLAAGIGLLQAVKGTLNILVALVFFSGLAACIFSILAGEVQHAYYRSARDAKARIEGRLELGDLSIRTTSGMGGPVHIFGTVLSYNRFLLGVLAAADIGGVTFALYRLGH